MTPINVLLMDAANTLQPTENLFSRLTLFEKSLSKFHLPYKLITLLAVIFIGPLGNFLFLFVVSFDIQRAFYATFVSMNAGEAGFLPEMPLNWYSLISNITWYFFLFYVGFSIRYLRLALAKLEPKLVSLNSGGAKSLTGIFRLVSHPIPQLVITFIFLFIYGTSVPNLIIKGELTNLSTPIFIIRSLLRSLMFGSILWLYFASLWGLYRFGKKYPRFKSFLEDPMLGAGVLGAMSFSLSKIYFIGLSIFAVQMAFGELVGNSTIVNFVVMLVLIPLGMALFLAPLVSTHKRMIEVKKNELEIIRRRFAEYINHFTNLDQKGDGLLTKLLMLESLEKKAAAISTWPIESPVIGRFFAIPSSVFAIILARYIQIFLHI